MKELSLILKLIVLPFFLPGAFCLSIPYIIQILDPIRFESPGWLLPIACGAGLLLLVLLRSVIAKFIALWRD